MELLENIPPFYTGQKVIFIGPSNPGKTVLVRNQVYTIAQCVYQPSGNPISPLDKKYWYVGIEGYLNGMAYLAPYIFRPLQEIYTPMTFSEIVEVEELEILLAN